MKPGFCLICYQFLPDELSNQKPEIVQSISTLLALPNIPYESIFKDSLICARCYENCINSYEALEKLKEIQEEIFNLRSFFENEFKCGYELSLTRGNKVPEFLDYNEERTKIVKKLDLIQVQNTTSLSQKSKKLKVDRNKDGIQEIANHIKNDYDEPGPEPDHTVDVEGYFNDLNNFLEEQENDSYILPDIPIPSDDEDCDPCWTPANEKDSNTLPSSEANKNFQLKDLQIEIRRLELPSDCTTFNIEENEYIASFIKYEKYNCFIRKRTRIVGSPEPAHKKPKGEFMYCSYAHEGCIFKSRIDRILDSHQKRVHEGAKKYRQYKCPICSKDKLFDKTDLKKHMLSHQTEKLFTCHECGRSYKYPNSLQKHLTEVHGHGHANVRSFTCPVCSKNYKSKTSLKEHLLLHEGIKPKCPICSREFAVKNSLDQHLLISHTKNEDKPFKCTEPECTKAYINNYSLQKHINRSHLKQRNFKCDECGKSYFTLFILRAHKEKHRGIRRFQCSVCPASFFTVSHLKRHELCVHVDDVKSFQCDLCEMSFVSHHNLTTHKWRHRKQMEKGRQFIPRPSRQNTAYQKKEEENTLK